MVLEIKKSTATEKRFKKDLKKSCKSVLMWYYRLRDKEKHEPKPKPIESKTMTNSKYVSKQVQAAKMIRKILKDANPGQKFSVKCDGYAAIAIEYTGAVSKESIEKLAAPFQTYAGIDLADDYAHDVHNDNLPQVRFVHVTRTAPEPASVTDGHEARAAACIKRLEALTQKQQEDKAESSEKAPQDIAQAAKQVADILDSVEILTNFSARTIYKQEADDHGNRFILVNVAGRVEFFKIDEDNRAHPENYIKFAEQYGQHLAKLLTKEVNTKDMAATIKRLEQ
jgi:hypothetical protein